MSISPRIQLVKMQIMVPQCKEYELWKLIFSKSKLLIAQQDIRGNA